MADRLNNWLDSDEVPAVGFATTPRRVASPESFLESIATKSPESSSLSRRPTISSSSGSRYSSLTDTLSRKSSASTAASTAPSENGQVSLHGHVVAPPYIAATLPAADYYLQCEFEFSGCRVWFLPDDRERWIAHSLSHFGRAGPPPKTICTICDDATFETAGDRGDRVSNWTTRMQHVADHFNTERTFDDSRPDFSVIEYMELEGLISEEDFKSAMGYSERPKIETLVPFDHKTPEMLITERRDEAVVQVYNKRDEDRQRQRQRQRRHKNAK